MKISIALCTYNGAKFLAEQLESFLQQTRLPDELVVCDDCSTDGTLPILQDFARRSPFPVHIHSNENNLGSTKNFEKAICLCQGDIIFLADQDDVWLPEKIQLSEAEFLQDANVGMVFCNGEVVDENLKSKNITSWDLRDLKGANLKKFRSGNTFGILREGNVVSGCMMAFRAEFRNLLLPIPTDLPDVIHDYWIALLLSLVSRSVALPSKPLVKYRQHSNQQLGLRRNFVELPKINLLQRVRQKNLFDEHLLLIKKIQERLDERGGEASYIDSVTYLSQYIAHIHARLAVQDKKTARISTVFRELTTLRYHRYSNGMKSAFKDLII